MPKIALVKGKTRVFYKGFAHLLFKVIIAANGVKQPLASILKA